VRGAACRVAAADRHMAPRVQSCSDPPWMVVGALTHGDACVVRLPVEPDRNLLGRVRPEPLMNRGQTHAGGRRHRPDGQDLVGRHHRPEAFPLSPGTSCGGQPKPGGRSRLMLDTLPEGFRGFHVLHPEHSAGTSCRPGNGSCQCCMVLPSCDGSVCSEAVVQGSKSPQSGEVPTSEEDLDFLEGNLLAAC
jgi:hypothetical protein